MERRDCIPYRASRLQHVRLGPTQEWDILGYQLFSRRVESNGGKQHLRQGGFLVGRATCDEISASRSQPLFRLIDLKVPNVPEDNWVLAPTFEIDIHLPEYWAYLQFSNGQVNTTSPVRDPDVRE